MTPSNDEDFDEKVRDISELYITAPERAKQGEQTLSIDEMTGVQALERKAPDLPLAPGKVQRREFEYIRHGTQALIINPEATRWHIVVDGLNTHKSETLVRTVAKYEDLDIDLGIKGKHGILKINDDTHCFFE